MATIDPQVLEKLCYNEQGILKTKSECRASLINKLILDDMIDIDEAENHVDKFLREKNYWNEPTLEEILGDMTEEET
ncbi:MAG: hypothetical protein WCV84_02965 [Patescibacteria group bacterium]